MATWLVAAGHEVRVVTTPPFYPAGVVFPGFRNVWSSRVFEGVGVFRCPVYVRPANAGWRRMLHVLSFALSSFPVMLRQVFWRPDVVWVVEPTLAVAPTAWLVARLSRAKAWMHVQDFEVGMAIVTGQLSNETVKRMAYWADWIADAVGVLLGWMWVRYRSRRSRSS